jgi:hypothetical protein
VHVHCMGMHSAAAKGIGPPVSSQLKCGDSLSSGSRAETLSQKMCSWPQSAQSHLRPSVHQHSRSRESLWLEAVRALGRFP